METVPPQPHAAAGVGRHKLATKTSVVSAAGCALIVGGRRGDAEGEHRQRKTRERWRLAE
jgi:hypothetical protein